MDPLDVFPLPPSVRQPNGNTRHDGEEAADDLPSALRALLYIRNDGAGCPCGGYSSRSALLFAFLTGAVGRGIGGDTIVAACLDEAHAGCGIREHVRENGGRPYLLRQIKQAQEKTDEVRPEMATDLGNARRLVRLYGDDMRFVHLWCKWLTWDGRHWRVDDDGAAMRIAKVTVEEMFAEAGRINDEARRTAMRAHALGSQSAQRLNAMLKLAESESEVVLPITKLDADPYLAGVENGVVDLRTGAFREARRDDYVTKRLGTIKLTARIFSAKSGEAFLEYLRGFEAQTPDDVRRYAHEIYGI